MSHPVNKLCEFGEFRLDAQQRLLRRGKELIPLTPKAFEMLLVFVRSDGKIITKDELMKAVWSDNFVEESNLTQTIFVLRKALAETSERRYILTIPGRGYRFAVQVKEIGRDEPGSDEPRSEEVPPSPAIADSAISAKAEWPSLLKWPLLVAALLALTFGVLGIRFHWFQPAARAQTAAPRLLLAVLPFQNLTGDPGQEYISDGLTEEMISDLGRLSPDRLGVIGRTSVMLYKQNPKSLDQVGRDLGVQYVIEGSLRRDSDHVRITAQLIQVKDQTHIWARNYDRELRDLLNVQSEISREIADEVEFILDGPHKSKALRRLATPANTTSYEAYDLYLKGLFFWNKRTPAGFQQAADYFQQAIDKDPNYARAYAGLADTFGLMSTWMQVPQNEFMPKARIAALKALEIDERLAEAHTSLALFAKNYDYDWQTAEREFQRAILLDPSYATAHQWYAECLSFQGRFDEALAESERARQLDPLSLIIATDHGATLYLARQYDRAIAQFRAVLDMDPSFIRASTLLASVYVQEGRFGDAEEELNRIHFAADSPWSWAWKARLYGRWGRTVESNQAVAKFEHLASKMGPDRTLATLSVYLGVGRKDQALNLLQKAYSEHSNVVTLLKVDPMYDPLRDDPRSQDLLRRVGLAQ